MKKFLKEPLLHFLLIGTVLFLANKIIHPEANAGAAVIILNEKDIALGIETFRSNYDREPSDKELKDLAELYLLEEIFFQEAIAMKMNENDAAVKRLLAQKFEEFIREQVDAYSPGNDSLEAFFQKNKERFPDLKAGENITEEMKPVILSEWKKEYRDDLKTMMTDKTRAKYKVETDSRKLKELLEIK